MILFLVTEKSVIPVNGALESNKCSFKKGGEQSQDPAPYNEKHGHSTGWLQRLVMQLLPLKNGNPNRKETEKC